MGSEREESLWSSSIIIFDTNSILQLYRMTNSTKQTMLEILSYFKDRIWIPAHVIYEYNKNRQVAISNLFREKYLNPSFFNSDYMKLLSDYLNDLDKNKDQHPYVDEDKYDLIKKDADVIQKKMKEIRDTITKQYAKRKNEISKIKEHDSILRQVSYFESGEPFTYNKILDISSVH
jgi:hypothetical protein